MNVSENSQINPYVGKTETKEGAKSILSTIAVLILAPLLALFITSFVFQSYQVDGPSMQSTLQNKDRLVVLKLPRTISRITKKPYIPKRADIVIFNKHGSIDIATQQDKQLVKRVVGLPGERVVVDEGKITIYNQDSPTGFNPDISEAYSESVGYTPGKVDITVPANEIFVVGDNRTNSSDSRFFGTVPVRDIVGEVILRILPINSARAF